MSEPTDIAPAADPARDDALSTLRMLGFLPDFSSLNPGASATDLAPTPMAPVTAAQAPAAHEPTQLDTPPDFVGETQMPEDQVAPVPGLPAFGDVNTAYNRAGRAETGAENAAMTAAGAEFGAKQSHEQALAGAQESYADRVFRSQGDYQRNLEAAHRAAAAETHTWMSEMDRKASQEPSPGRWFENQSTFGKALWLLSLAVGAAAQAKSPQARNVALDMINKEIESDVAIQRERLDKELTSLRNKGQVMREDQKQRVTDLGNSYEMELGRWNALLGAAKVRAEVSGSADERAAMARATALIEARKTDIATKVFDQSLRERSAQVEMAHGTSMENLKFAHQKELAQIEISGRVAAASAKGAGERLAVPLAAGVALVNPTTGERMNLELPKGELGEKATKAMQDATTEMEALKHLSTTLGKSTRWGLVTGSDAAARQAIYDALVPIELKEGGVRAVDQKSAADRIVSSITGTTPDSVWNYVKGITPNDMKALVDRRIDSLNRATSVNLSQVPGTNLAEAEGRGFKLGFVAPPTGNIEPPKVTAEALTGKPLPRPTDPDKLRAMEESGEAIAPLPEDLAGAVAEARNKAIQLSHGGGMDAITAALKTVADWEKNQANATWIPKDLAEVHSEADQARAELKLAAETSGKQLGKEMEIVDALGALRAHGGTPTRSDVTTMATRKNLKLSADEVDEVMKAISAVGN